MLSFGGSLKSSRCEEGRDVLASNLPFSRRTGSCISAELRRPMSVRNRDLGSFHFPLADSGAVIDQWTMPALLLANW